MRGLRARLPGSRQLGWFSQPARHTPLRSFVALTTIGCALWAAGLVLVGMIAATAWSTVDSMLGRALLAIGVLTLVASVLGTRRPH